MNHTLVIPTFNRHEHLTRLINYYLNISSDINIVVLDSSNDVVKESNIKMLSRYDDNIQHFAFNTNILMAEKLYQGLLCVKTEYVSLCGDDDLVFLPSINNSIKFLNNNKDYIAAHGLYINFNVDEKNIKINREYNGSSIDENHFGARISRLMESYESTFYAVYRTEDLISIFTMLHQIPSLHFQELFQSVSTMIKGKVHRSNDIYGARQTCEAAEPTRNKWQTFYWFAEDQTEIFEHYRLYCDDLWGFYLNEKSPGKLDRNKFNKIINLTHASYFTIAKAHNYFKTILEEYWHDDQKQRGIIDKFNELKQISESKKDITYMILLKILSLVEDKLSLYQQSSIKKSKISLDKESKDITNIAFRCELVDDIGWLVINEKFRKAYKELCIYLSDGKSI